MVPHKSATQLVRDLTSSFCLCEHQPLVWCTSMYSRQTLRPHKINTSFKKIKKERRKEFISVLSWTETFWNLPHPVQMYPFHPQWALQVAGVLWVLLAWQVRRAESVPQSSLLCIHFCSLPSPVNPHKPPRIPRKRRFRYCDTQSCSILMKTLIPWGFMFRPVT